MPSVTIKYTGDYTKTKNWLQKMKSNWLMRHLDKYGKEGATALASATPRNTGATAASWSYVIESGPGFSRIVWTNNNTNGPVNIALILQQGHGTRNGGYVQGRDYINPAIRPIFDKLANEAWKEVTES